MTMSRRAPRPRRRSRCAVGASGSTRCRRAAARARCPEAPPTRYQDPPSWRSACRASTPKSEGSVPSDRRRTPRRIRTDQEPGEPALTTSRVETPPRPRPAAKDARPGAAAMLAGPATTAPAPRVPAARTRRRGATSNRASPQAAYHNGPERSPVGDANHLPGRQNREQHHQRVPAGIGALQHRHRHQGHHRRREDSEPVAVDGSCKHEHRGDAGDPREEGRSPENELVGASVRIDHHAGERRVQHVVAQGVVVAECRPRAMDGERGASPRSRRTRGSHPSASDAWNDGDAPSGRARPVDFAAQLGGGEDAEGRPRRMGESRSSRRRSHGAAEPGEGGRPGRP